MKLDHLVILVSNPDASVPFYDALFAAIGWTKLRDHVWRDPGGVAFECKPAAAESRPYERYAPGLNHLGVTAPSRAAVRAVAAQMDEAGFEVAPAQLLGDDYALFLRDPDGMRVEVTAYGGSPP